MPAIQSPRDLFYYDLCAMYDAEQKLVQVLPQLAQECQDNQAREAFTQHEQETREHVRNLEQCFQILGSQPTALENHTINGLKQDHDTFVQQQPPREALTMFDVDAGYQSEHIEIAAYHRLIDAANSVGLHQCVPLFQQNLQQDEAEAKKLGSIAHQLNQQVASAAQAPQQGQPYAPGNMPPMGQPDVMPSPQVAGQGYSSTSQRTSLSSQLQPGMGVICSDSVSIGTVRDVRDKDFLVNLPTQRHIYVPFDAIQEVTIDRVTLNIPADQLKNKDWPHSPLTES